MNYNETSVSGSSWIRCSNISISNPLTGYIDLNAIVLPEGTNVSLLVPGISFGEEKVILVDGKVIRTSIPVSPSNMLHKKFDPQSTIPVLNPQTGESTGQTITHADLYTYLYSLYLQTAQERDAQLAAQQPTNP